MILLHFRGWGRASPRMTQREKERERGTGRRRVLEWVSHDNTPTTNRPKLIYGDYLQKFHLESRLIHNFIKKSNLLFITASILSTTWGFSQGASVMRGRAGPAALIWESTDLNLGHWTVCITDALERLLTNIRPQMEGPVMWPGPESWPRPHDPSRTRRLSVETALVN